MNTLFYALKILVKIDRISRCALCIGLDQIVLYALQQWWATYGPRDHFMRPPAVTER